MNLSIKQPKKNEISYLKKLWNDYDENKEHGSHFDITDEQLEQWYETIVLGDETNNYNLIYKDNTPIGEISYRKINDRYHLSYRIEVAHRDEAILRDSIKLLVNKFNKNIGKKDLIMQIGLYLQDHKKIFEDLGFDEFKDEEEKMSCNLKLNWEKFNEE